MADEVEQKDKDTEKDPLSFFAAGDDSSSSDSEDEGYDNEINVKVDKNDKANDSNDSIASKLPSPHTLFASVGRPSFLNTNQEESTVDWDKLSTKYNQAVYAAAPVVSLEEREKDDSYSDAMITSNPIKYGKELSDIQKHIVIHGKRGSDIRLMTHRESSDKNPGESKAKKAKPD
ncbi:uncharacterized protein LOC116293785 [Actinia tenebrosa]|uniref:Uncharacterized protein LOC116293785 n=1 Tax=Actinia tenebrosa TaxID=6105 RepID=A0A6P8HN44_ACTTE|nr:uncharacterized protein LOC116293785 [Actinia tenebrosa]